MPLSTSPTRTNLLQMYGEMETTSRRFNVHIAHLTRSYCTVGREEQRLSFILLNSERMTVFLLRNSVKLAKEVSVPAILFTKNSGPAVMSVQKMAASIRPDKLPRSVRDLMSRFQNRATRFSNSVMIGASALGLGALCYYGLNLSQHEFTEGGSVWPDYVKERIKTTYKYIGGSLAIAGVSAMACIRIPMISSAIASHPWKAVLGAVSALVGTSFLVHSIPYRPGFGPKQMLWALHSATIGAAIAPPCVLGGPRLIRALLYTAGIVGGLSAVAACTPSEKFLNVGGPAAIGFGVIFAAAVSSLLVPPTTTAGTSLYSISLYGGLILFVVFLLYHTQHLVHNAELHPLHATVPYDPINASIGIYMDVAQIFVRMASLLMGDHSKNQ